jgi:hypothetical protein
MDLGIAGPEFRRGIGRILVEPRVAVGRNFIEKRRRKPAEKEQRGAENEALNSHQVGGATAGAALE